VKSAQNPLFRLRDLPSKWNLLEENANAPQEEIPRRTGQYTGRCVRSASLWKALTCTFPHHKHQPDPEQHEGIGTRLGRGDCGEGQSAGVLIGFAIFKEADARTGVSYSGGQVSYIDVLETGVPSYVTVVVTSPRELVGGWKIVW